MREMSISLSHTHRRVSQRLAGCRAFVSHLLQYVLAGWLYGGGMCVPACMRSHTTFRSPEWALENGDVFFMSQRRRVHPLRNNWQSAFHVGRKRKARLPARRGWCLKLYGNRGRCIFFLYRWLHINITSFTPMHVE
jgi:hypothetical protein